MHNLCVPNYLVITNFASAINKSYSYILTYNEVIIITMVAIIVIIIIIKIYLNNLNYYTYRLHYYHFKAA